jgi:hypothetical protein
MHIYIYLYKSTHIGMAVGSMATSVESAITISPSVMVIFIVFGGLYVAHTPSYLAFIPKISLIRWAYEALCVNEFTGLVLKPESETGPLSVTSGDQVLVNMGYGPGKSTVKGALVAQIGIILFNYMFTYLSLVRQKPDFEQIKNSEYNENKNEKTENENNENENNAAKDTKNNENLRIESSADMFLKKTSAKPLLFKLKSTTEKGY